MTDNAVYKISQAKDSGAMIAGVYEVPISESGSIAQATESTNEYATLGPNEELVI